MPTSEQTLRNIDLIVAELTEKGWPVPTRANNLVIWSGPSTAVIGAWFHEDRIEICYRTEGTKVALDLVDPNALVNAINTLRPFLTGNDQPDIVELWKRAIEAIKSNRQLDNEAGLVALAPKPLPVEPPKTPFPANALQHSY